MNFTVASLYKFTKIENPSEKKIPLLSLCRSMGIKGTLLLANEGINGTISGRDKEIRTVLNYLRTFPEIRDIDIKYSYSKHQNFKRLKIKVKDEIVTMRHERINVDKDSGKYVDPKDWNGLVRRKDVLLIDARNKYEFRIGRFSNAIDPKIDNFHEFPKWAEHLASQLDKPSVIAMYCTGGIRCEKATAYMSHLGFSEIYQLKGGILKYLEEVPEDKSLWDGECFVFDERVSLKHGLTLGNYKLCYGCQQPISQFDCESSLYEKGVSCPHCHDSLSEEDKARFRERQKQVVLAIARGQRHLGDQDPSATSDRSGTV